MSAFKNNSQLPVDSITPNDTQPCPSRRREHPVTLTGTDLDFAPGIIKQVAGHLLGAANDCLSKDDDLRYGNHGSLSIKPSANNFYDHEAGHGGGVLDLIVHRGAAADRSSAVQWMRKHGLVAPQETSATEVRQVRQVRDTPAAEYDYLDSDGRLLFQVVRRAPKSFFQRRPAPGGKSWINNLKGVTQVPYRLPDLLASPEATVYVVEGEKDADRLASLGLVATCNAGGAGKWRAEHGEHLADRDIVILPDNDDAGSKHARQVLHDLHGKARSVRILALPDLPEKGDVSDWLDAGGTAEQLRELTQGATAASEDDGADIGAEAPNERSSQVDTLVSYATERYDLLHDRNKDAYARERSTGIVIRLNGRQFRDVLAAGYYAAYRQPARDTSLRDALATLGAQARYEGAAEDVHVRVARHGANYYLDLCEPGNSRAIELTAGSWRIVDKPPVNFVRSDSMQPLPAPVHGGSIEPLWDIVNAPAGQHLLVLAWLIDAMRPETPYPGLELIGEQGSGKSTATMALRRLIDPNSADLRSAPRSVDDMYISAAHNHIMALENISHLPAAMQDALCVLSTGGGYAKRKLYSDDEEHIIQVRRPWIINGIAACVTQQDLIDRVLSVECPVIAVRESSTQQRQAFEAARPGILGGLLDLAAMALVELPGITIAPGHRPRLLEYATLAMAAAKASGKDPAVALKAFKALRAETIARTLDASPVATAIVNLMLSREKFKGTVKDLLAMLDDGYKPHGAEAWPRSPKGLGDALRKIAPALRQMDFECYSIGKNSAGSIEWYIGKVQPRAEVTSSLPEVTPDLPDIPDLGSDFDSGPVVEVEL